MTAERTRLALVLMLAVVLVAGLYLGWHFTHLHHQATDTACSGWSWCKK